VIVLNSGADLTGHVVYSSSYFLCLERFKNGVQGKMGTDLGDNMEMKESLAMGWEFVRMVRPRVGF